MGLGPFFTAEMDLEEFRLPLFFSAGKVGVAPSSLGSKLDCLVAKREEVGVG